MKSKNMPKSTNPSKIIKWVSRLNEIERNGGGQFVSMNRVYKDKSKYNRNDKKKELRNNLNSYFFSYARFKLPFLCNGLESACLEYFSMS